MWLLKLDDATLELLDTVQQTLGEKSRGRILDQAVTYLWRTTMSQKENRAWCSSVTAGSREEEILRRLCDLAALLGVDRVLSAMNRPIRPEGEGPKDPQSRCQSDFVDTPKCFLLTLSRCCL